MPLQRGLVVEDFPDAALWLKETLCASFPGIAVDVAGTLAAGRELLRTARPEIALIDLVLPDGSGIQLVAEARSRAPAIPVIVTTVYDDDDHIFPALRAGACGYLLKEESRDNLVRQIQAVIRGELPLSPAVARQVMRYFTGGKTGQEHVETLTAKEREVLKCIASGLTLDEVARRLAVSRNTVHTHVKRVYDKLDISTRAEATVIAARLGLIRF